MVSGGCLCGAVRYEIDGRISPIVLCHCSKCRKANGSAFHAGSVCRSRKFRWVAGREAITRFKTESGYTTQFCSTCGSPVPSEPSSEGLVVLPTGALDQDPGSRPFGHIWVGSKAAWYEIKDDLPQRLEDDRTP
jgi:hypothetical protein